MLHASTSTTVNGRKKKSCKIEAFDTSVVGRRSIPPATREPIVLPRASRGRERSSRLTVAEIVGGKTVTMPRRQITLCM